MSPISLVQMVSFMVDILKFVKSFVHLKSVDRCHFGEKQSLDRVPPLFEVPVTFHKSAIVETNTDTEGENFHSCSLLF